MYSISTRLSGPFATIHWVSDTEMRFACVECAAPGPSSAKLMSSVLDEANTATREAPATLQWPAAIAEAVTDSLSARVASGAPTATLLFAALQMTMDTVWICTAGDFRIHLIVDELITEVTRDHIMQSDSTVWVPGMAATVPTRWLGGHSLAPPECHTWKAPETCTIAVCSSQLHHHCAPPRYKHEVLAQFDLPMHMSQERLAVWIERTCVGSVAG